MNINKSNEQLMQELNDKINYLEKNYKETLKMSINDPLRKQTCDTIAVIIRTLVIDTKRQVSLLINLNIRNYFYFKYKGSVLTGKNNLHPESLLTGFSINDEQLFFYPLLDEDKNELYINFDDWINEIIIDDKTDSNNLVSRYEVITAIADKEGAHVDLKHDVKLHKIANVNKLNITYQINDLKVKASNNIYYETLITISKELIDSYHLYKELKELNKQIILLDEKFISEEYVLSKNILGYRYNRWFAGKYVEGRGALNTIVFDSNKLVTKVTIGTVKIYWFSKGGISKTIKIIDFNNNLNGLIIQNKNPFCMVAVEKIKKQYLILSGSTVSKDSTITNKDFEFPGKSLIIKNDIRCSKSEIHLKIGINPIDI